MLFLIADITDLITEYQSDFDDFFAGCVGFATHVLIGAVALWSVFLAFRIGQMVYAAIEGRAIRQDDQDEYFAELEHRDEEGDD